MYNCTLYLQYWYLTRLWRVCQARTSKFPKPLNALQTWIFLKAGTDFLKFRKKCRYSFKILKFRLIFQMWPKYSDTKKKIRICNTIMQCIIILTVSQWTNLNIECLEIQSFVASFWIKKQIPVSRNFVMFRGLSSFDVKVILKKIESNIKNLFD